MLSKGEKNVRYAFAINCQLGLAVHIDYIIEAQTPEHTHTHTHTHTHPQGGKKRKERGEGSLAEWETERESERDRWREEGWQKRWKGERKRQNMFCHYGEEQCGGYTRSMTKAVYVRDGS